MSDITIVCSPNITSDRWLYPNDRQKKSGASGAPEKVYNRDQTP
jgi:hypothetical protein